MDAPIKLGDLHPTRPPAGPTDTPPIRLSPEEVATTASRIAVETKAIARHAYDPSVWLYRAESLERLGYTELAASDAWKAERLCHSMLISVQDHLGEGWRMGSHKGFWMRDESADSDELEEETYRLRETLSEILDEASAAQHRNLYFSPAQKEGSYVPQPYPWLEQQHKIRSDGLVAEMNGELHENVVLAPDGEPYCEIRRCTFGEVAGKESNQAGPLGVFATRDISKGTVVLVDKSDLFGCIGAGVDNNRANLHGGSGCTNPAHPNAPSTDTSLELRWVRDRHGTRASEALLLCQVLRACVQVKPKHPLDLSEIARLVPTYHRRRSKTFWLEDQIATPNEALQQFGVDIYASPQFESWVLFTVIARMDNNSWSNPICAVLSSLFCVFNHSCEPNITWKTRCDHLTIDLTAQRDIAKGEQMFVEYDGSVHDRSLPERRKRLARWIDGPCLCTRCVAEEAHEDDLKAAGAYDVTSPDNTTLDSTDPPEWDDSQALSFPNPEAW